MKSNKIAFFVPGFRNNIDDDQAIPALYEYINYCSKQHEVVVYSFQYPYEKKKYKLGNILVYSAGGANRGSLSRILNLIKISFQFLRDNKTINYDFIHSFWIGETSFLATILGMLKKKKVVCSIGGMELFSDVNDGMTKAGRKLNQILINSTLKSKSVLTIGSSNAFNMFEEYLKNNVVKVIPLGIEESIQSCTSEKSIDVIVVSNLTKNKNVIEALRIITELRKSHTNIVVEIIGDGEKREELEEYISEKDLIKNVKLLGNINRKDVLEKLKNSKALLHTAFYESQGYVFYEAAEAGCYIVSKSVGVAENNNGYLIYKNENNAVEKIKEILAGNKEYSKPKVVYLNETLKMFEEIYFD